MRCARGYICSSGNICCPSYDYGIIMTSTTNPMKNPFLCTDGTQAAGACILGQCGQPFKCMNGLCCNVTNNTPRCLDGTPSVGACVFGQCGGDFVCTAGNICCSASSIGMCPNNAASIGTCINGLCPTGYTCINGQCCPQTSNTTFRCSNPNYALGPCVAGRCPDDGFQCDTTINSCCPLIDPVGPCIEPDDQCPPGNRCFKEGASPQCYKECGNRGTISGSPIDGACPTGTTLIFGYCCILKARLYNPIQASFFPERHTDHYSWPIASGIRSCPDNTEAVSACINGQCGYGYQCYNNVCCPPQYTNFMLPFSSTLRPIGGSCEFTQQCMSSMEGLSICELGICRCLPGAQVNGFSCIRRFSIPLNDAGQSSVNGTSINEPDIVVADN
ncbi:hypothetical protein LOAG_11636 [Loa loa]|uniref:CC domain-containing protein n=1 Tax=Loa loa TaxID=7209 RepID=A0A1S0TMT2_LOALO|nr:hypothetical protein LOAG_11636 [Loa loa]EFO16867.1 hypothetical protein LOAG_11636 [Loa loa]